MSREEPKDTEKHNGGAVSALPLAAGSAADQIATWNLVRDLHNALAAAMRTLAARGTCDDFFAEVQAAGVANGIGDRSRAWLDSHSPPVRSEPLFSISRFRSVLVKHGIVFPEAIEDAEGFDGERTLAATRAAYDELMANARPDAGREKGSL